MHINRYNRQIYIHTNICIIVRLLAREINVNFKEMSVRNMSFSGSCVSEKYFREYLA